MPSRAVLIGVARTLLDDKAGEEQPKTDTHEGDHVGWHSLASNGCSCSEHGHGDCVLQQVHRHENEESAGKMKAIHSNINFTEGRSGSQRCKCLQQDSQEASVTTVMLPECDAEGSSWQNQQQEVQKCSNDLCTAHLPAEGARPIPK